MPDYLDASLWSITHNVQDSIIDPEDDADEEADEHLIRYQIMEQTHVIDINLLKELLSE